MLSRAVFSRPHLLQWPQCADRGLHPKGVDPFGGARGPQQCDVPLGGPRGAPEADGLRLCHRQEVSQRAWESSEWLLSPLKSSDLNGRLNSFEILHAILIQ